MIKLRPFDHFVVTFLFSLLIYFIIYEIGYFISPLKIFIDDTNQNLIKPIEFLLPMLSTMFTVSIMFITISITFLQKKFYGILAARIILLSADNNKCSKYNLIKRCIYFFRDTRLVDDIINMISLLISATIMILFGFGVVSMIFICLSLVSFYMSLVACFRYLSTEDYNWVAVQYITNYIEDSICNSKMISKIGSKLDFDPCILVGLRDYIIDTSYLSYEVFDDDLELFNKFISKIIDKKKSGFFIGYIIIFTMKKILDSKQTEYKDIQLFEKRKVKFKQQLNEILDKEDSKQYKDDYKILVRLV